MTFIPKPKSEDGYSIQEIKAILSADEFKRFGKWMYGQTCPIMEDGKVGFYEYDVLRFIRIVRKGAPDIWD